MNLFIRPAGPGQSFGTVWAAGVVPQRTRTKELWRAIQQVQVICNGEEVAELTGTQAEYHVEVWSGNHPFYKGDGSALVVDEGQVNKFKARFAGSALGNVATLSDSMKNEKEAAPAS